MLPFEPEIPPEIIQAAEKGKLVAFVGSGVSRIVGCCSWDELSQRYLKFVKDNCSLAYHQYDSLKACSNRKLLTICKTILKQKAPQKKFDFEKNLEFDQVKERMYPIYDFLYDWNIAYITTNYDYGFKRVIKSRKRNETKENIEESKDESLPISYSPEQMLQSNLDSGQVIHLHGSIDDVKNIILTLDDYVKHYKNTDTVPKFLKDLFREFTVLFLGYGLEEYEILEWLISLSGNKKDHFVLYPMLSRNEGKLEYEKIYYEKMGLTLIPYNIDKSGYEQLFYVIKNWSLKLAHIAKARQFYEKESNIFNSIETEVLDKDVLNLIKNNIAYKNIFFDKAKSSKWFDILKKEDFFEVESVPFDVRYWVPLDYFRKLATQIKEKGDIDGTCVKLLAVIRNVTEYRNKEGKSIDNYFVWHGFNEVLQAIPNDKIQAYFKEQNVDFSNWLEVWLSSIYDTSLVAQDLSEQLLSKFITENPEDIKIAEKIVLCLLEIDFKLNKDFGKSRMKKEAVLRVKDDYFIVEGLLDRYGVKKLGEKCSLDFIVTLAQRLNNVLQQEHFSIDFDFSEIEGKEGWRISLFRNENEQGQIVDGSYYVKFYKIEGDEYKEFVKKTYWDSEYWASGNVIWEDVVHVCFNADVFASDVLKKIDVNEDMKIINNDVKSYLVNVFNEINYDLTHVSFESLEKGSDLHLREARDILIMVLRDVVLGKVANIPEDDSAKQDLDKILDEFLTTKYPFPVFIRLLLLILKYHYDEFNSFFWKLLEVNQGVFYLPSYDVELHECLKANADKFQKKDDLRRLKEAILFVPDKVKNIFEESHIFLFQQGYFETLATNSFFGDLAVKWQKKTNSNKILPRSKESTTWTGNGQTFVTIDQFLNINTSNEDIVELIESLKDEDMWGQKQRTVEATADELQKAVKQKPDKFYPHLTPFLKSKFAFVNELLVGFRSSLDEQKTLDWNKIFDFILKYFKTDYFKNNERDHYSTYFTNAYRSWIVSSTAELIRAEGQNDERERPIDYFEQGEKVFNKLFEVWEGELPKKANIQEVINTSRGHVIGAYIIFSLQKARINHKQGKDKSFSTEIFDDWFKDEIPEAFTLFGRYLPNMMFLNEGWMFDKLKEFKFLNKEKILWKGFFQGYVWSSGLNEKIFQAMMENQHYQAAIETKLDYDQVRRQIVDHAGFSFMVGFKNQTLDKPDSLIRHLLDSYDYETYSLLIDSFWGRARDVVKKTEEKEKNEKYLIKIKEFWLWIFNRDDLQEKFGENYENLLAHLSRLICIFDNFDEENVFEQVMKVAPHVDRYRDSTFFVEYLNKYCDRKDVKKVGKIFLEMLKETLPVYKKEDIYSIVKKLYDKKFTDTANQITEIYGKNSLHFLRDLWEKNNKN